MLTIRTAQRRAMQEALYEAYACALVQHVHATLPAVAASMVPALLDKRVRWALRRAAELGFVTRIDLQSFVSLVFAVGPAIDQHPLAAEVFASAGIPPGRKIDALIARLASPDWEAIAGFADPVDWPGSPGYPA